MESLIKAQKLIESSQDILIFPSAEAQGDSLGAAMALFFTLKKLGKNVNLSADAIPERFQFLADTKEPPRDFIISVNTAENVISKLRYEKNENGLKIYLTTKGSSLKPAHISFPSEEINDIIGAEERTARDPDLAIIIGAASLESLGDYFKKNAELLSQISILNLDNQPFNENFGDINLLEITSALSEITLDLIEALESSQTDLLDQKTATALLTGIIWSSQNFRNPRTRPKTFKAAVSLIDRGADHQAIIHHLYRQKKLSQIKLLGRILERLALNEEKQLCLVSLSENDFTECRANSKDLSFAVEELKQNFRYLPNLLVLWESHASPLVIKGVFHSPNQNLIRKILENFEGISRGSSSLFIVRVDDLQSAREKILAII
ncbi:MAG: hypothetical protein HYT21_02115 [Candidatus Nealsonbacteria bacterium]|nr:hypothetical protein [Candidatus Nealsonbacteria bacterium]